MKNFLDLIRENLADVREIMPWEMAARLAKNPDLLIVDVREPHEYDAMHIAGSLNVPRGILESACEWEYEETVPELVEAREREIVVVCRSGYRSVLAVHSLQLLGFRNAVLPEDRHSRLEGQRAAPGKQERGRGRSGRRRCLFHAEPASGPDAPQTLTSYARPGRNPRAAP